MRACFGRSRGGNIAIAEDGGHYSSVTEYLIVDTMGVTGFGNALDTPRMMAPGSDDGDGASPSGGDSYPEQKLNDFQWHAKWADMTAEQQGKIKFGIENLLTQSVTFTVQTALMSE